jgi:hypothetical protein
MNPQRFQFIGKDLVVTFSSFACNESSQVGRFGGYAIFSLNLTFDFFHRESINIGLYRYAWQEISVYRSLTISNWNFSLDHSNVHDSNQTRICIDQSCKAFNPDNALYAPHQQISIFLPNLFGTEDLFAPTSICACSLIRNHSEVSCLGAWSAVGIPKDCHQAPFGGAIFTGTLPGEPGDIMIGIGLRAHNQTVSNARSKEIILWKAVRLTIQDTPETKTAVILTSRNIAIALATLIIICATLGILLRRRKNRNFLREVPVSEMGQDFGMALESRLSAFSSKQRSFKDSILPFKEGRNYGDSELQDCNALETQLLVRLSDNNLAFK